MTIRVQLAWRGMDEKNTLRFWPPFDPLLRFATAPL